MQKDNTTVADSKELRYAIKASRILDVQRLIDFNKKLLYESDSVGQGPLHWAVKGNSRTMILFLIQKGALINAIDVAGRTPLHLAGRYDYYKTVRLLLENGGDLSIKSLNGATPLEACARGSIAHAYIKRYIKNL